MHFVFLSLSLSLSTRLSLFFGLAGHIRTWHVEDQSAASVANLAIEDRLSISVFNLLLSIDMPIRTDYTSPPYLILIVILPYIKGSDSLALRICITTISSSFTSSNFDPFGATKPCAESGSRTRFALLVSISCRVYCSL